MSFTRVLSLSIFLAVVGPSTEATSVPLTFLGLPANAARADVVKTLRKESFLIKTYGISTLSGYPSESLMIQGKWIGEQVSGYLNLNTKGEMESISICSLTRARSEAGISGGRYLRDMLVPKIMAKFGKASEGPSEITIGNKYPFSIKWEDKSQSTLYVSYGYSSRDPCIVSVDYRFAPGPAESIATKSTFPSAISVTTSNINANISEYFKKAAKSLITRKAEQIDTGATYGLHVEADPNLLLVYEVSFDSTSPSRSHGIGVYSRTSGGDYLLRIGDSTRAVPLLNTLLAQAQRNAAGNNYDFLTRNVTYRMRLVSNDGTRVYFEFCPNAQRCVHTPGSLVWYQPLSS